MEVAASARIDVLASTATREDIVKGTTEPGRASGSSGNPSAPTSLPEWCARASCAAPPWVSPGDTPAKAARLSWSATRDTSPTFTQGDAKMSMNVRPFPVYVTRASVSTRPGPFAASAKKVTRETNAATSVKILTSVFVTWTSATAVTASTRPAATTASATPGRYPVETERRV